MDVLQCFFLFLNTIFVFDSVAKRFIYARPKLGCTNDKQIKLRNFKFLILFKNGGKWKTCEKLFYRLNIKNIIHVAQCGIELVMYRNICWGWKCLSTPKRRRLQQNHRAELKTFFCIVSVALQLQPFFFIVEEEKMCKHRDL